VSDGVLSGQLNKWIYLFKNMDRNFFKEEDMLASAIAKTPSKDQMLMLTKARARRVRVLALGQE
jgi:hypothetical protein